MTYLNDRNHDVFISYAHADDDPTHWVKHFGLHLEKELGNQLKIKEWVEDPVLVEVWKDNQLPAQGNLSERLEREIKDSSLFLVIMSESYLISEWCKKEGIMFVNSLKDKSDMRIFIVEKEETDKKRWPDFLKVKEGDSLISVPFYQKEDVGKTKTIQMITPQGAPNPIANEEIHKLCDSISTTLLSIKRSPETYTNSGGKNVFLAISPEGKEYEYRKKLVDFLKQSDDISILPPQEQKIKDIEETLSKYLSQCQIFAQILGHAQGLYLSDRSSGFVGHQYEEALNHGIKIVHWFDPELDKESFENGPYKQLIAELKPKTEGGTVVEGSLKNFAQRIHDELGKTESAPTPSRPHKYFVEMRYLIDDDEYGHEVGDEIKNFSSDIPIEPIYPKSELRAKDIDQIRKIARGTIIVWTKDDNWVLRNWGDLEVDDKKVDRIAVCDPVPKLFDFGEKIRWADSAKRSSDLEEFIKKLKESTT